MRTLLLTTLLISHAAAAPVSLQHQARLIDAAGGPLNGEHSIVLSLWTDSDSTESSAQLWSATYPTTLADGYIGLVLNQSDGGDAVDSEWFTDDVWLQTAVDGVALLPRSPILDVPGTSLGVASTAVARPSTPVPGQLWFDRETSGLEVFVDGEWTAVTRNASIPASCAQARQNGQTSSGIYTLDPDGSGPGTNVSAYCDMTTAGGGWTRVFVANQNNYSSSSLPYITGLSGPLIAESTEMMMAYTNPLSGSLVNAWYFPTPQNVASTTPMAVGQCSYYTNSFTRVADNTTSTRTLRMGWGSFGATCDQGCTSTWGQVCLKQSATQGTADGFSDFPQFATFAVGTSDHCSASNQDYRSTNCADSRRFTILVR